MFVILVEIDLRFVRSSYPTPTVCSILFDQMGNGKILGKSVDAQKQYNEWLLSLQ